MTAAVPPLRDLLANYLEQAATAPLLPVSEVEPHQATAPAWADPHAVWPEALRAGQLLAAWQPGQLAVSPLWAKQVSTLGTQRAVTFCLGHIPQLLYDVSPLLSQGRAALPTPTPRPDAGPAPESQPRGATRAERLLYAACLRMGGHFQAAEEVLTALAADAGKEETLLLTNERAALAWHRGDIPQAVKLWSAYAAEPVCAFNLGLAALCQGDVNTATAHLQHAAASLPEHDPWYHLAQLYLTLAE